MLAGIKKLRDEFHNSGKPKEIDIDNEVFKLHYILLFRGLLVAALLVTANEYIGKNIECTHGERDDGKKERLEHIMGQYCLYFSLFTVPEHYNNSYAASPGVGPYVENAGTEIDRLTWYPWVPYILTLQACCFYFPRLVWRVIEGKRIYRFSQSITLFDSYPDDEEEMLKLQAYRELPRHLRVNTDWPLKYMFCEILNVINIFVQFNITDWFLNGHFWHLGQDYYEHYNDEKFRTLDSFFPKVAKCSFPKFGQTGTIQYQDLVCVLSYNVLNEKIYLILWHVYIVVAAASVMMLVHRIVSWILYKTRIQYNASLLVRNMPQKPNMSHLFFLMDKLSYLEWFFLRKLITNLKADTGSKFLTGTAVQAGSTADNPNKKYSRL